MTKNLKRAIRVVSYRSNDPNNTRKPQELIEIRGHHELTLTARRAITVLWQNAHSQSIEKGRTYTIETSRLRTDKHKGKETIGEAIEQLMQQVVYVPKEGKAERAQILGPNTLHDNGVLEYSFPDMLVDILKESSLWGPIELPVLMSFSSKYTVSLYEHLCQWINLDYVQDKPFSLDEFRELMGVEKTAYAAFGDLNRYVIKPAIAEINALASFNAKIVPIKAGRRVASLRLHWWEKDQKEKEQAYQEHQRPRVGRRARIQGLVEHVTPPTPSPHTLAKRARIETPDE